MNITKPKKILKLLFFLMIGITVLSKDAEAGPTHHTYVTSYKIGSRSTLSSSCQSSGSGYCYSCNVTGYQDTGYSSSSQCYCGDVNCTSFSSKTACSSCQAGYNLDSSYGCCLHLTGYTSGGGGLCNVQSTHACSSSNCGSGKYRNSTSSSCTCVTCPSNASCSGDGIFVCNTGYFKSSVSATACTACSTGATACTSSSVDTSCASGYYLKSNKCTICPSNAVCSGGLASFVCMSGYETSDSSCIETCSTALYRDSSGNCASCPNNASCNGSSTFTCSSGFTNTGSACICSGGFVVGSTCYSSCPSNATCDGTDFTCNTGYTKETYTCSTTPTILSSCSSGFTRSSDGCCCLK